MVNVNIDVNANNDICGMCGFEWNSERHINDECVNLDDDIRANDELEGVNEGRGK